jgi:hypothetical protein
MHTKIDFVLGIGILGLAIGAAYPLTDRVLSAASIQHELDQQAPAALPSVQKPEAEQRPRAFAPELVAFAVGHESRVARARLDRFDARCPRLHAGFVRRAAVY